MKKFLYRLQITSFWLFFKDIFMFFKFRHNMKSLERHNDEEFIKHGFKTNTIGNIVYTQLNLTEKEIADTGYNPIKAVQKKMDAHIDYFCDNGYGNYLVPQISNFQDDDGNISLSYLILYIFAPIKFSFWKLIKILFSVGLISAICYFGYIWYIGTYM